MKNSTALMVLFLASLNLFAQPKMDYDDDYEVNSTLKTPEKVPYCPDGFILSNGKLLQKAIVLNNTMAYKIGDGFFNNEKKLMTLEEIADKLVTFTNSGCSILSATIVIMNYKPYLVANYAGTLKVNKIKIIIPLVEENNYLKMQGTPTKQSTIVGKTKIILYDLIETKINEYVGHVALLK